MANESLKKLFPRKLVYVRQRFYEDKLVNIIAAADKFAKPFGKTYVDVSLEAKSSEEYGSISTELHLELSRIETTKEWNIRLAKERARLEAQEVHEKLELERLKTKYTK